MRNIKYLSITQISDMVEEIINSYMSGDYSKMTDGIDEFNNDREVFQFAMTDILTTLKDSESIANGISQEYVKERDRRIEDMDSIEGMKRWWKRQQKRMYEETIEHCTAKKNSLKDFVSYDEDGKFVYPKKENTNEG